MQNQRFSPAENTASQPRHFKVVVAFDDTATSSPALKTCDYVIQQLGDEILVRRKVVAFNRETTRRHRAAAARDAAKADMVIVATREGKQLPLPMQEWVDQWAANRSAHEGALVAILNPSGKRGSKSVRDQLADVARQANMDFFSSEVSPL